MQRKEDKKFQRDCRNAFKHKNKIESSKIIWVHKGREFAGGFKSYVKLRKKRVFSTTSEFKAAFAERKY